MNLTMYDIDVESTPYVVVYGTLKEGHSNHRLLKGCPFMGVGKVYGDRTLNDTYPPTFCHTEGESYIPFEGELYQVTARDLQWLDDLEGHPHGWYRTQVDVHTYEGDGVVNTYRAWCYFYYIEDESPCSIENGAYVWREEK